MALVFFIFVSKAQHAADLDSTGKKSLGTLFALDWLLLLTLPFAPFSFYFIFFSYISLLF